MNKTITCLALTLLIGIVIVSATYTPIDYKAKCYWTRPSTLSVDKNNMQLWDEGIITSASRPERTFQGIYGRMSDGSITCFNPGSNHHKVDTTIITSIVPSEPDCTTSETEVCNDVNVCVDHCHWEKVCTHWNWHCGHKQCSHYSWEKECHQECHTETSCHKETINTCTE